MAQGPAMRKQLSCFTGKDLWFSTRRSSVSALADGALLLWTPERSTPPLKAQGLSCVS